MRRLSLYLVLLLVLSGCRLPASIPGLAAPTMQGAGLSEQAPMTLSGQVRFSDQRSVQTDVGEVGQGAGVALINIGTNQTVATALTDAAGHFLLRFQAGFKPDKTALYYLEAVKGLGNNLPGHNMVRVRTIARFQDGWQTITNLVPNAGIVVSPATTALALGAALRNGNPSPFDFSSLLGTVSAETYTPVSGLTQDDFDSLETLVNQSLAADQDPVRYLAYDSGTNSWINLSDPIPPAVETMSPTRGAIGSTVTLTGTGFHTIKTDNVVLFNGTPAVVSAATPTSLTTTVPAGATSGQVTVRVGTMTYMGPTFTIDITLSSLTPATGKAGTVVTLVGSGFDTTSLAGNVVTLNGAAATVTAVSTSFMKVTVPAGAVSGPFRVSVAGSSATSPTFSVPVTITSFSPLNALAGTTVSLMGIGFSSTPASNSIRFNGVPAAVTSASPYVLTTTLPTTTTGLLTVTVNGQTGTGPFPFQYGGSAPGRLFRRSWAPCSPTLARRRRTGA